MLESVIGDKCQERDGNKRWNNLQHWTIEKFFVVSCSSQSFS